MNIIFTIGDVNGIGLEVLFKALKSNESWFDSHCFSIMGNAIVLKYVIEKYYTNFASVCEKGKDILLKSGNNIKIIEINNTNIRLIGKEIRDKKLDLDIGKVSKEAGAISKHSIIEATQLTISKDFDALITLPICKKAIHLIDKFFIGHTELITNICSKKNSIMVLFSDNLRIALATIHIPLFKVSRQITAKRLRALIKCFNSTLKKDFGINCPKIAMLGLNPHSGDSSMFGSEEHKIINPTIKVMQKKGINVEGAFSSDGFFASKNYLNYDGVIAMYHDQGLIPLKMLSEYSGVNFTANLQIVRTSPDHGTAFEIAGKNIANEQSMVAAVNSAIYIVKNRENYNQKKNILII